MRFWAFLLLAGCGAAAPEVDAPVVQINPTDEADTPPPTGMPAPFDADRPITVYRIAKGAKVTGGPPGLPPELMEAAQQTMRELAGSGLLPPGLTVTPTIAAPLDPAWTEAGFVAVQSHVIEDPAMRAQLRRIFGRPTNYVSSDAECFEPSMLVRFGDEGQVAVSLPCNRAVARGFPWPHPHDGLGEETRHWLEAFHGSLFGVAPPG